MAKPQIIGIRFSDNDFSQTIRKFLELLGEQHHRMLDEEDGVPFNKARIVTLFNKSVLGLYWLIQNKLEYNLDIEGYDQRMADYLQIEDRHVFFDAEVAAFRESVKNNDNGEFFVLDMTQKPPYIYSI